MNYVHVSTDVRSNANISKEINPEMGLRLNSGNKGHIGFFYMLPNICICFFYLKSFYG